MWHNDLETPSRTTPKNEIITNGHSLPIFDATAANRMRDLVTLTVYLLNFKSSHVSDASWSAGPVALNDPRLSVLKLQLLSVNVVDELGLGLGRIDLGIDPDIDLNSLLRINFSLF